MEIALRQTQTHFYALDMKHVGEDFKVDDGFNILKLKVKQAEQDGSLNFIASTYDPNDQIIREGIYEGGRKIISFCGVLRQGVFPLTDILKLAMKHGAESMKRPVEIEFACTLNNDHTGEFYLLQIRPIVDSKQMLEEDISSIPDEYCLLRSNNSLGHGIGDDITDVLYIKTDDKFTAANNPAIANEIEHINRKYMEDGRSYMLIGPGRWGSSDPWLGVPVKWSHISAAKVIVETTLKNYSVDPSQGTHFFQNLTSFGVGYFTIDENKGMGFMRKEILDAMPATLETAFVRCVRFKQPLHVMMDGLKQEGVVLMSKE